MSSHVGGDQRQPVTDQERDQCVRSGEEYFVQVPGRAVCRGIQENEQQDAQTEVDRRHADHPRALAPVHLEEEQKWYQSQESADPVELINNAIAHSLQLDQEIQGVAEDIRGLGFLVLAASEGMDEAAQLARIAPFHGRIGHASQGHIKIKRCSGHPTEAQEKHYQPFIPELPGVSGELNPGDERSQGEHQAERAQTGYGDNQEENGGLRGVQTEFREGLFRQDGKPNISYDGKPPNDVEHRRSLCFAPGRSGCVLARV